MRISRRLQVCYSVSCVLKFKCIMWYSVLCREERSEECGKVVTESSQGSNCQYRGICKKRMSL